MRTDNYTKFPEHVQQLPWFAYTGIRSNHGHNIRVGDTIDRRGFVVGVDHTFGDEGYAALLFVRRDGTMDSIGVNVKARFNTHVEIVGYTGKVNFADYVEKTQTAQEPAQEPTGEQQPQPQPQPKAKKTKPKTKRVHKLLQDSPAGDKAREQFKAKYPHADITSFGPGGKGVVVDCVCVKCDTRMHRRNTQDVFQSATCPSCKKNKNA